MDSNQFYMRVAEALTGCQLVEQELKLYISQALELIRRRVAGRLPFKMSGADYADNALGRLIDVFAKLSDAPQLVTDLRKFQAKRNFLSHKGITRCLDPDGEVDHVAASEYEQQLNAIRPESERLRAAIWTEFHKFAGDLWLDVMK